MAILQTKLSRFADGLMESSWLAACILAPVFFNIYSSRIFEPEKIALLRSLALLIFAAWIIKWLEDGGPRWINLQLQDGWLRTIFRLPLVLPALSYALVVLASSIFSVTPAVSLWGSYPRLQGAYTTFAYLVIFSAMLVHLRSRKQVERLVLVIVLSSLPVSLYGVLQRYGLDPIPWGGDVTQRIAANLGNSIFVAAYLIMVFPLTLMRMIEAFEDLLQADGFPLPEFLRATGYVFIAALQLVAIYFSGSRGPWLGLGISLVVLWLGLSLIWRKRWLTWTGVCLVVLVAGFLLVLNIPGGPLDNLRNRPEFGRLGQLLDSESRTGRVRTLIWQGSAELAMPHEPLSYPDGREDPWNALRPLIGYGPESMYVAYNRFYPPELALVEKRTASPDRAHNETWDSLVMNGVAGLITYLFLFGSLVYFGLKWLGLVQNRRQKVLFLIFIFLGGLISTLIFVSWRGIAYLGVALPFGMLVGAMGYFLLSSLLGWFEPVTTRQGRLRAYLLLGLLSAVIAHFMEINFGIAIAVTRTYFWVYAALLFLVGYWLPRSDEYPQAELEPISQGLWRAQGEPCESSAATAPEKKVSRSAVKGKTSSQKPRPSGLRKKRHAPQKTKKMLDLSEFQRKILWMGLVLAILIAALGYDYLMNNQQALSVGTVIWESMVRIKGNTQSSVGILSLVLTTLFLGAVLFVSEFQHGTLPAPARGLWLKQFLGVLFTTILVAGLFWLVQAGKLVSLAENSASTVDDVLEQVKTSENLPAGFYVYLLVIISLLAGLFAGKEKGSTKFSSFGRGIPSAGIFLLALLLAFYTNLRPIQADIAFKTAELFAKPGSWSVAIKVYSRAKELAPNEDYYYLFLGRAYLEEAKLMEDPGERDALMNQAALDLNKAQEINPLNTDHSANLARLYNLWATYSSDRAAANERALLSDKYFSTALTLSPNNSRLWNEWASLKMNLLDQPDEALHFLQRSLELDSTYDYTYALLGDYYSRLVDYTPDDPQAKLEALERAADFYRQALKLGYSTSESMPFNYALALASIEMQMGRLEQAEQSLSLALNLAPEGSEWRVYELMSRLYYQKGDTDRAIQLANNALSLAPLDAQERIREFLSDIGG